ncbi:hypothetical protein AB0K60_37330 [Thermopolyspora sp. NPDC052614]|uniref:hypothetical protein n=1 Tax=Thermopolyspora sp. NPDC052614 TaxID=3155682 RepID=UPI0034392D90
MTTLITVMISTLLGAVATGPAAARPGPRGGGHGDGRNFDVYARSLVHLNGSGYRRNGTPNVPPNFKPPRCWYQPRYTQDEMYAWARRNFEAWHHQGPEDQRLAQEWYEKIRDEIGKHDGEAGKIWWFLSDDGTAEGAACYARTRPFYKYVGPRPPIAKDDQIIDPVDLSYIARANLTLPKPRIRLNPPGGRSFVGLETWVEVTDPPLLTVTASVRGVPGLSAQIEARPAKVIIKASGGDPDIQDKRNSCPAYRKGMSPKDGCWVRFNRSSLQGRFTITVTRKWDVTTNVEGVTFDEGRVDATTTVRIDEIQSTVVR